MGFDSKGKLYFENLDKEGLVFYRINQDKSVDQIDRTYLTHCGGKLRNNILSIDPVYDSNHHIAEINLDSGRVSRSIARYESGDSEEHAVDKQGNIYVPFGNGAIVKINKK